MSDTDSPAPTPAGPETTPNRPQFIAPEEFLNMWSPPKILSKTWEIILVEAVFTHSNEDDCNGRRYDFVVAWLKALDRVSNEADVTFIRVNGRCIIATIKECRKTLYVEDGKKAKFIPQTIKMLGDRHLDVGSFLTAFLQDVYSFLRSRKRSIVCADIKRSTEEVLALHLDRIVNIESESDARFESVEDRLEKLEAGNVELAKQIRALITETNRSSSDLFGLRTRYETLEGQVNRDNENRAFERRRHVEGSRYK